jgi:hypothetical protein
MNIHAARITRVLAAAVATLAVAACAQRATMSSLSPEPIADDEPPLACVYSDTGTHRLSVVGSSGVGQPRAVTGIVRGTDHELVRNASVITMQPLEGGRTLRARADSSGHFEVAGVAAGKYELRVVSIGYLTSRDTITVPEAGLSLQLTQRIMRFLDEEALCGYLASIDSEPLLVLPHGEKAEATHAMPNGGSLLTSLVARPSVNGARFELVVRNVGAVPVDIFRLCYPRIFGDPVRTMRGGVGPACYGAAQKLAPGDSVTMRQTVQLRGKPGTYAFRFHALDPTSLDAVLPLTLARGETRRSVER